MEKNINMKATIASLFDEINRLLLNIDLAKREALILKQDMKLLQKAFEEESK